MGNKAIQKIKLFMNYDVSKTLNENVVENNLIDLEEQKALKIAGEDIGMLKAAFEDAFKSTEALGKVEIKNAEGAVVAPKNADELMSALKDGRITPKTLSGVNVGLLKSARTPENVIDVIINNPNFNKRFAEQYGKLLNDEGQLYSQLRSKGYPDNVIKKMVARAKGENFVKLGGDATKVGGAAGEDITKAFKEGHLTINGPVTINNGIMTTVTGDGNKITQAIAQDGSKAIANDAEVIKGGDIIENGKKRRIKPDPTDEQTIIDNGNKRKTKKPVPEPVTKKLNNKWKWALGLLGGGALAWWAIYQSKKERVPQLNDCVMGLVDAGIGVYGHTSGGDLVVIVKQTGDPAMDATGGAYVYMNGRVVSKDGRKRGTWKCKAGASTGGAQIGAADATMPQPINEQASGNLNADVTKMIDLLDFPVTGQDLKDARALLKKYYGTGQAKTFLDRYQKSGLGGGDLLKTLNFIFTSNPESVENKDALIRMYQEMRDSKDVKRGGKLADYLDIVWDGGNDKDDGGGGGDDDKIVPTPETEKIAYHDCSTKDLEKGDTLEIGCVHPAIKKLQECKLSKGADLGPSGADGKFGPKLSGLLGGVKVIDKALYDAQMATCATATTTGTTTGSTQTVTGTTTGDTASQTARVADMVKTTDSVNKPEPEKTQEIIDLTEKGHEIYTRLYNNFKNGRIIPFIKGGGSRIIYKGDLLSQSDLDALNAYIRTLGFAFEKQKDKQYDEDDGKEIKYKWTKRSAAPAAPVTPDNGGAGEEPEAAQPQNLSENLIKNIVSKHLRSRL